MAHAVTFKRFDLSADFLAEGANFGDFNRDGVDDAVAGPYWYEGPRFTTRYEIYAPVLFDPKGYSDNFFAYVHDFDSDQWDDVLFVGFPGQAARWFRNPGNSAQRWEANEVFATVGNEAPALVDLFQEDQEGKKGNPSLVFNTDGQLGFARPNAEPRLPWSFHPITPPGPYGVFAHGLGVGDMDRDGDLDLLEATGWWEHPTTSSGEALWQKHAAVFGAGGAQMFAYDVDGDGDQDVVTTLQAHGYGVAWFERRDESGQATFVQHLISSAEGGMDALHEPHALTLADMNGDGLLDVVTGERFWGHVPAGDPDPNAPARLMWFELKRGGFGAAFVPHVIDAASGVGTQIVARDVNGDARPDIIVANKKGAVVFLQVSPQAP
ncbi:MAG: VCBS repeat-containing protein [Deltaproteobacteria bacterium]|nr:VCBS repeat-containing protein [Deltaproteobacteria bacterium]